MPKPVTMSATGMSYLPSAGMGRGIVPAGAAKPVARMPEGSVGNSGISVLPAAVEALDCSSRTLPSGGALTASFRSEELSSGATTTAPEAVSSDMDVGAASASSTVETKPAPPSDFQVERRAARLCDTQEERTDAVEERIIDRVGAVLPKGKDMRLKCAQLQAPERMVQHPQSQYEESQREALAQGSMHSAMQAFERRLSALEQFVHSRESDEAVIGAVTTAVEERISVVIEQHMKNIFALLRHGTKDRFPRAKPPPVAEQGDPLALSDAAVDALTDPMKSYENAIRDLRRHTEAIRMSPISSSPSSTGGCRDFRRRSEQHTQAAGADTEGNSAFSFSKWAEYGSLIIAGGARSVGSFRSPPSGRSCSSQQSRSTSHGCGEHRVGSGGRYRAASWDSTTRRRGRGGAKHGTDEAEASGSHGLPAVPSASSAYGGPAGDQALAVSREEAFNVYVGTPASAGPRELSADSKSSLLSL